MDMKNWAFIFILCFGLFSLAEESPFQAGVKLYQEKKFDKAKEAFEQALTEQPDNPTFLTNLALTQYQLGQKGWALALLRRAIFLDPDFSTSRAAMDFVLPQIEVKEIPHEIQWFETIRSQALSHVTLQGLLLIIAFFVAACGWLWLRYLGHRRQAIKTEKAFPAFPSVALVLSLGLLILIFLCVLKIQDNFISRGTVVSEKTSALSLPEEKAVVLFDLYQGLEVIIERTQNDWVQVTYPGGLTGWIPRKDIFQSSGSKLW